MSQLLRELVNHQIIDENGDRIYSKCGSRDDCPYEIRDSKHSSLYKLRRQDSRDDASRYKLRRHVLRDGSGSSGYPTNFDWKRHFLGLREREKNPNGTNKHMEKQYRYWHNKQIFN